MWFPPPFCAENLKKDKIMYYVLLMLVLIVWRMVLGLLLNLKMKTCTLGYCSSKPIIVTVLLSYY